MHCSKIRKLQSCLFCRALDISTFNKIMVSSDDFAVCWQSRTDTWRRPRVCKYIFVKCVDLKRKPLDKTENVNVQKSAILCSSFHTFELSNLGVYQFLLTQTIQCPDLTPSSTFRVPPFTPRSTLFLYFSLTLPTNNVSSCPWPQERR